MEKLRKVITRQGAFRHDEIAQQDSQAAQASSDDLSAATIRMKLPNPAADGKRVSTLMREDEEAEADFGQMFTGKS